MSRSPRSLSHGFSTLEAPAWLAVALLVGVGCGSDEPVDTGDTGVAEVESIAPTFYRYLQGHFDSADQAATNPSYYAIELTMCEVEAPELGAMALYVEQALAGDEPYRQRIYVIEDGEQPDVQARSVMYELNHTTPWSGFCDGESTATGVVTPEYVSKLEGCDVTVAWDGERFTGSTVEGECLNDWGGATYATSEVMLADDRLESWDQGWDANGNYVWGATAGPYEFIRRTELVVE
jgi:CpeT protein